MERQKENSYEKNERIQTYIFKGRKEEKTMAAQNEQT